MTKLLSDAPDRSLSGIALLRIDVNAADDWRLKAVIPTIEYLATRARKVIVLSHKGRPAPGGRLGKDSLWSDAQKLQELVDQDVWFITDRFIDEQEYLDEQNDVNLRGILK
jgi:phosphoglycerate kinase